MARKKRTILGDRRSMGGTGATPNLPTPKSPVEALGDADPVDAKRADFLAHIEQFRDAPVDEVKSVIAFDQFEGEDPSITAPALPNEDEA